jgi:hypothetical protein
MMDFFGNEEKETSKLTLRVYPKSMNGIPVNLNNKAMLENFLFSNLYFCHIKTFQ